MSSTKVQIPNRFEALVNMAADGDPELHTIVKPVKAALDAIDVIYDDMTSAGQGAFLVVHGHPGSGKSTFLHTIKLFRPGVRTIKVDAEQPIEEALEDQLETPDRLRIVVLTGREALVNISEADLDLSLHAINQFIRSKEGRNTIVVWPCTSEDAVRKILAKAAAIGGDALLGAYPSGYRFEGPPKEEYVAIARDTIEALNGGASLIALGVTEDRARYLAREATTIGTFLKSLREEERRNRTTLATLLPAVQRTMLWVVVVAGDDPETAVGTLTYGADFSADITRLLASTDANVVKDLKKYPDKLGLLGRFFDARILYLPFMTAISVVRDFAEEPLRKQLSSLSFPATGVGDGVQRLLESQLARAFRSEQVGVRAVGRKPGEERQKEFQLLTQFAKKDDGSLNETMGRGLGKAALIASYKTESTVGTLQERNTDLLCTTPQGYQVRLEFMWRAQTSVGEIAKYALEKLYHYGKAIGFLNGA